MNHQRLLALAVALVAPLALHAQTNTVFNDGITGDSLQPATYPAVTATSTGWDVLSSKSPTPPTNTSGLQINMVSTTSGFIEAQALFAAQPVQLLPGTFIELTATFVPTSVLVKASDTFSVGLYNSGGSAPLNTLISSGLTTALATSDTGGAQGWVGYTGYAAFTGGTSKTFTRPSQVIVNNTDQDVTIDAQSSSAGFTNPASATIASTSAATASATLVNGLTYTVDFKLALNAAGTQLTTTYSLFNGAGTTNTGANTLLATYSGTTTAATLLQNPPVFDAMAFGWRADAGALGNVNFSSITVNTTGGAPWFITQPLANTTVSVGSPLNLTASVGGVIGSEQWQVSTDGGNTFANLDTTANPSAATSNLNIASAQNTDAGIYRLIATNSVGSATSQNAAVTVTAAAVPASITANPTGGTVLVGTNFTLSVVAGGTAPLTYQWLVSTDNGATFSNVSGATASSLAFTPAALANSGVYEVTVANSAGSATSTPVTLSVVQAPAIDTQPVGATLHAGDPYTLSVDASGTPPPTFQWFRNGVAVQGATNSSLNLTASGATAGNYTVVVSNSAGGSVTSAPASIAVLSSSLGASAFTPVSGGAGLNPDTRLTIAFNGTVAAGVSGQIRIYDSANPSAPVDTIDLVQATTLEASLRAQSTVSTLALPVANKTVGGVTNFNFYPITFSGNTATIYPRNNILTYGHTYFVQVDPGVFTDGTGLTWAGIGDNSTWTFSTKAANTAAGSSQIVVAADGSGDFCTVQGALDSVPSGNSTPVTILLRPGTYFEQCYYTGKNDITILGADRNQSIIAYPNNNTFNNVSGTFHRMVFEADHVTNATFVNLTIQNTTPHGGSQAEALIVNGTASAQAIVTNVNLVSFQDTFQSNGQAYISDSHISGDVDFMWGQGPSYFVNDELTAVTSAGFYTQIRNVAGTHGNVYVNCTFDAATGVTGSFLGRIDPTVFPNSEVVLINSSLSNTLNAAGWQLNNATTAPNIDWAYSGLTNLGAATAFNTASWQFAVALSDPNAIANFQVPSFVLGNNWTPSLAPVILVQPAATASVAQGSTATFAVTAAGAPEPAYRWSLNGAALTDGPQADGSIVSGSAAATLTIQNSAADQNGASLTVAVSNAAGSVGSNASALTVIAPLPSFTTQPQSQTIASGGSATFTGAASGANSFQWLFNGAPIAGATSTTLTVGSVAPTNAGTYTLVATNPSGNQPSTAAVLNVTAAAGQPTLPVIPNGLFTVTAFGAKGDGATDNTAAIQAAITAAQNAGGGTVEIPAAAGSFLCGPITIGASISLQVDAGATLQMLPMSAYPDPSNNPANFISFKSGSNVQVVGGGTIDGNGAAWYTAFNANSSLKRPQMVKFSSNTAVLVAGVTLANAPTEHLVIDAGNNVTIDGITIAAPANSPNTDGIDPAGTNFLIENCTINCGDDNIAVKPQNSFCSNFVITGCAFGSGHGLSVGGQTNDGLNGMTVTNCTFNGTTTGLRLKADATEGGPVQNLTYSNITMTNVPSPIVFYSYYNQIGSPGAASGSSQTTPAKVNAFNANPPNSLNSTTIPTWQNITISNLTATGASAYSIIWGIPLQNALWTNVTLNNVNITGGTGLEIFDATNVQLTGTNSVGPIVNANDLAVTGQPQNASAVAGQSATFTAAIAGASGQTNAAPVLQWAFNGQPLTDGPQADGSVVAGSATGTLQLSNLQVGDAGSYALTASNQLDGYNVAGGALAPNSLPVSVTSSPATLAVGVGSASISLSNLALTYNGTAQGATVTTSPANLPVTVTYNGSPTVPTNAGTYTVVATINSPSFAGTTTGSLTIAKAAATVAVTGYNLPYDGSAHTATGTATGLGGISLATGFDLSQTAHTYPGSTQDSWTFHDASGNYADASGTVTDVITITALVQHGITVNGGEIDGSVQVLNAESDTLNSHGMISGDLLVVGTPNVVLNSHPTYGSTLTGPGSASPSNFSVTLNSNAVLSHVVRQVNAAAMPTVAAPPKPSGTRNVTLNKAGDPTGDFATVNNLTMNSNVGSVAVPAGTYGSFTVNGGGTLVLGVAGATEPSAYNFQGLVLNSNAQIQIVGPVTLTTAGSVTLNGAIVASSHPEWLVLRIASGGLTLNSNVSVSGFVIAPNGTVSLNSNATLTGEIVAGTLVVNSNGNLVDPGAAADASFDPWE